MSCSGNSDCLCGACAGTSIQTPQPETNLPGLPAVARRVGTWAQFNESMLARLSSSDYPALHPLKTRDNDDFTIALLDATSVMLDILTFYQERLANECYLRTARQTRSLTELSRLIGYQPTPGVSASVYVAFTLTSATGQPANPNAPAITIPQGTQVQSVPAQGQAPQTFETSADIPAKADWSQLPVQTGVAWASPWLGSAGIYLSGTATQLKPGDSLLILGSEREHWAAASSRLARSDQWDVVVLNQVQTDTARNLTWVAWDANTSPLKHEPTFSGHKKSHAPMGAKAHYQNQLKAATSVKVFAFRQKAGLFGNNAPNPNLFVNNNVPPTKQDPQPAPVPSLPNLISSSWIWNNYYLTSQTKIDLDAAYQKIVPDGWFALTLGGYAQLFRVVNATGISRADFGLSGKVTELEPDYLDPWIGTETSPWALPTTEVWAQSDQLTVAEQPLSYPLYGNLVSLEVLRNDLGGVQVIALSGTRQKIQFTALNTTLAFLADDPAAGSRSLALNEILTLTSAANLPVDSTGACEDWSQITTPAILYVEDEYGRTGSLQGAAPNTGVPPNCFILAPSAANDPVVSEYALVSQVDSTGLSNTKFRLAAPLIYCYDRTTTTVNANVGLATAGQSVTELLGSGSAATPNQSFTLRQSPLTFVSAVTPTGFASTLEVQANGMDWTEVPSLYQAAPTAPVYATLNQSDGTTDVLFGDGVEGATLPTGQNNIQANYRIGSGSAGNVAAGTLTTLIDRPLGVSGVTNPSAATGGQNPQTLSGIRQNAPQTVLTLGRAVSITDYQNFAGTFAGIAKAYAIWIPSGPAQGVFLTVAGTGGSALPAGNPTNANLLAALQAYGNPLIPISIQTYMETLFQITAKVQYDPAYQQPVVQAAILQTLAGTFNFASRAFGQGVSYDEVSTVIQNVSGVVAVNVISLVRVASSLGGDIGQAGVPTVSQWNLWYAALVSPPLVRPCLDPKNGLCCYLPVGNPQGSPQPAEILVLDPRTLGVTLGVMS